MFVCLQFERQPRISISRPKCWFSSRKHRHQVCSIPVQLLTTLPGANLVPGGAWPGALLSRAQVYLLQRVI